jgi:hypothetical protein
MKPKIEEINLKEDVSKVHLSYTVDPLLSQVCTL